MNASESGHSILAMADLATPMSIRVAATLGLVECAGAVGATTEELASRTGTFGPALRRLLDHLVAIGVFDLDQESGRYRPTGLGNQMSGDSPEGVKVLLDIDSAGGRAELAFVELLATIRTGTTAYPRRYGREFWADLDAEPALRTSFDAQMNWRFRIQATQIAERFDWGRFSDILDVGGGDGTLLAAILYAHPAVRGRVLDRAPTAAAATERFTAAGLSGRADAIAGSFFDTLPTGAEAYVLSDILHDWNDERAHAILSACAQAAGPNGVVVVIEPIRGKGADTAMDLFMLMCFDGHERSVEELTAMAQKCGLMLHASVAVADGRTALEFRLTPQHHSSSVEADR
ncbi:methyltransferase [Nocardia sp. NBC_01327]|uniref:methyltransferase n=1 Tax=Nocardia sp. NBC_01327 TaxID=2903593 RepID=UPI002E165E20|nr:methyltransferase [Nocardia sp. NBC_01327]